MADNSGPDPLSNCITQRIQAAPLCLTGQQVCVCRCRRNLCP